MRVWKTAAILLLMASPVLAGAGKVWIEPFTEANQPQQQPDWINRALAQSVSDDLSGIKGLTVVPAATRPADVSYVVSATIQRVSGDLRVTGRVEDASTHQIMGGFKATGSERDLFAIEDTMAQQLKQILAPDAPSITQPQPTTTAATNPFGPQRSQFQGSDLQRALEERDYLRRLAERNAYQNQPVPDYTYNQPVYPVDYGYGYNPYGYGYGYGYGGWLGGSVVIVNQKDRCFNNGSHGRWNRNCNSGSDFVANPGFSPTQTLGNGQRIRQVATFSGNVPSVMTNTPTAAPQLVPNSAPQLVPTRAPQLVPTRGPQLVPNGGPQLVPTGGPQMVSGGTVRGGGTGRAR
jgi:TolB-like protein